MAIRHKDVVEIDYTNWRGERSVRTVQPISIYYGERPFHPGQQWLLTAYDFDKQAQRDFAMKDIHSWKPSPTPTKDQP